MVNRPLRVLLVGGGRAGLVHGKNFAAGVRGGRLVGVADPDPAALDRAVKELECDLAFSDPNRAVVDHRIDAVVIASPTFTHAELAKSALAAGKHVLCEKPLASSLDEAQQVEEAVARSEAVFLMAFMRRFDVGFRRAAERLAAGDIGEPLLIRSTSRGPGLPPEWAWDVEQSGGLVAEVNSHDLDTLRWLSGQEFRRVFALGRAAKRPEIAERYPGFTDLIVATFEMTGATIGQVDGACPADYAYDARVEVYGSEGMLLAGDPRAHATLLVRRDGVVADPVPSWRTLFAAAYRAEDEHLVAVARGEEEPLTSVRDGLAALEAALAVNRAMALGQPTDVGGPVSA
ncbi:MAG TPA: Gfo/Idh/MocA family oxidoreductase [Acidimicrobiia bacterium]|nr:Gfo/Idh/MocA family oxidoreductase [Acidimicrobiia bacterium]